MELMALAGEASKSVYESSEEERVLREIERSGHSHS